ncbi:MAG: Asp-tRNA(Asn)/Glu-tRNA(Gln) amidotransferase subunit GatC [Acidobacteriia bacterium]|nr:Asp-tRNA(Asn)/Glu-tRNA(Gln) amidotransferase subunit GatC [Terriglobia bacterium]
MKISEEEVRYVAKLANLELTSEEVKTFTNQLSSILEHMETLSEVSTDHVEPMTRIPDFGELASSSTPFREDVPGPTIGTERALGNAPDPGEKYFRVPKVIADR